MEMLSEDVDLAKLREEAGLTLAVMAAHLEVSISQASRYEEKPDVTPLGVVRKWVALCGKLGGFEGMKIENPRTEIVERVKLIESYLAVDPNDGLTAVPDAPVYAAELLKTVKRTARKPRIAVLGKFDSGKSRLINTLLGGSPLPTGYQPLTSLLCFIRHVSDKPEWLAEDVMIVRKGFDLDRADDRLYCLGGTDDQGRLITGHKMLVGGLETLKQFGTHANSWKDQEEAEAAIVYIDAPILLGADLLDSPGFQNKESDSTRADLGKGLADIIVYASTTIGFLDENDIAYLGMMLGQLPAQLKEKQWFDPVRNLYVVATQAHIVPENDRPAILDAAARRCYHHLCDSVLARREAATGASISEEAFRSRFFTFSAEVKSIRDNFQEDLVALLCYLTPAATLSRLDENVRAVKREAKDKCDLWIERLQLGLTQQDRAKEDLRLLEKQEPDRLRQQESRTGSIRDSIVAHNTRCRDAVKDVFLELTGVGSIESLIEARYPNNKKEAQQLAASYLLQKLETRINAFVEKESKDFGREVDAFLESYGPKVDSATLSAGWGFNAKAAFMGGLTSLGTVGALAAWASIAAAGSNLGAYILIAQIVGWLSSIGISLGGTGTVVSAISAIGGPIVLAISIGILAFVGGMALFGDTWQRKLAKRIRENIVKNGIEGKFAQSVDQYWRDTKTAFDHATLATENAYQKNLAELRELANATDRAALEAKLAIAQEIRDFFAAIPWKAVTS